MPAGNRLRAAEADEGSVLFLGSYLRSIARIEADENDLVVAARIEGKHAQNAHHTHLNLVAQHGAMVINEGEDHGLPTEELAKLNVTAGFIAKMQTERHLAVERRFEAYILQDGRHGCGKM